MTFGDARLLMGVSNLVKAGRLLKALQKSPSISSSMREAAFLELDVGAMPLAHLSYFRISKKQKQHTEQTSQSTHCFFFTGELSIIGVPPLTLHSLRGHRDSPQIQRTNSKLHQTLDPATQA